MEPLVFLTALGIIFLVGIISTVISGKLKIPNILLLIIAGIIIGNIKYKGSQLISFPEIFLTSIGILALVMVVFDASSRFNLKEVDTFSVRAIKLVVIFLILNLIFLTTATKLIFGINSAILAAVFAALMSGTDTMAIMTMLKSSKTRVVKILEFESIINTPIVVIIPFLLIEFVKSVDIQLVYTKFIEQIAPFLQQFVSGLGAGLLIGIIALKLMKKQYSETLSPLALITSALLAYILAENLGGDGVIAVTVMGLIFGSSYVKEKSHLQEFSSLFSNTLEILVFVLVGMITTIPLTAKFLASSLALFALLLAIRFIAVNLTFKKGEFSAKEKLFMALNAQKGISIAVITFMLMAEYAKNLGTTPGIAEIPIITNLSLAFMIYSIIVSTVVVKFSGFFIKEKIEQPK